MTNYEILQYLIADGGSYTRDEHIALLSKAFPDEDITAYRISSLRCSMVRSKYITTEIVQVKANVRKLRVIASNPIYKNYARNMLSTSQKKKLGRHVKITDSYLASEPAPVVRSILLMRQFDKLISSVRRSYD